VDADIHVSLFPDWTSQTQPQVVRLERSGTVNFLPVPDGLVYMPHDQVQGHLHAGWLSRVLTKFTPDLVGYHHYYSNQRHASPAFKSFLEKLRYSMSAPA
jgi:DNA-binding transcriptional LysR family regulator